MRLFKLIALLLMTVLAHGQDPVFSQFTSNRLYLNPSFVGHLYRSSLGVNSRQQWINVPSTRLMGAYSFNQISFETFCSDVGLAYGLQMRNSIEGEGLLTTNSATLYAAKPIPLLPGNHRRHKVVLAFGMSLGISQKQLDWSRLTFSSQYHPYIGFYREAALVNPQLESSNIAIDPSAGLRLDFRNKRTKNVHKIGAAVYHFSRPTETFFGLQNRIPRRYTAFWSGIFIPPSFSRIKYLTNVGIALDYQDPLQTITGFVGQQINSSAFINLGLRHRNFTTIRERSDAIIMALQWQIEDYQIGISYDFTVNSLTDARSGGTIEVSATIPLSINPCFGRSNRRKDVQCSMFENLPERNGQRQFVNFAL
jgi:type IX secretion system PorP/SprF family membrane protein